LSYILLAIFDLYFVAILHSQLNEGLNFRNA